MAGRDLNNIVLLTVFIDTQGHEVAKNKNNVRNSLVPGIRYVWIDLLQ